MNLGDLDIQIISGGRFRMDGGAMFGVVPRPLWQKKITPDERHRIPMETNCLLIRTGEKNILVDTGYGTKGSDRDRDIFDLEPGRPLLDHLAEHKLSPDDIDIVILTHLHFDHAGGCTYLDEKGSPQPTFRNARHVVQKNEWDDASGRIPELKGAYFERDFQPLKDAGLVEMVEDEAIIAPGVSVRLAPGHTRGHQIVLLESGGQTAIYPCDLCPTFSHLRTFWTMSYDQSLLEVRRVKPGWIGRSADEGWLILSAHDIQTRAAYITRDEKEEFIIKEKLL